MNILNSNFWVVTKPTNRSVFVDICFKSDWKGIQAQFLGGLTLDQIHGIFTDEAEATRTANELLASR
jgi:hypothetical protein